MVVCLLFKSKMLDREQKYLRQEIITVFQYRMEWFEIKDKIHQLA